MSKTATQRCIRLWILLAATWWLTPAVAETAKVHLKDGTVMRGKVELTETEAIIRTIVGPVRCPRERIDHIDWLEPAKTVQAKYLRRLWTLAADDANGHFALAQWLVEQRLFDPARKRCAYVLELNPGHVGAKLLLQEAEQELAGPEQTEPAGERAATQPATQPGDSTPQAAGPPTKYKGVPPPPPLSRSDTLKLKLAELDVDGPAERIPVRFVKQRGQPDLEHLVRREMRTVSDYDPRWERILESGQPWEKLQVILKTTGLKYADRIELRGHPEKFLTYRRRVLPLVIKGCVRAGCHGGLTAEAFRFPTGSQTSNEFVYTSFLILDQMKTAAGPMIDRALPEESALVRYMLPADEDRPAHPPVERGRVVPVLRGTHDPRYRTTVDWISSLRSPHPDYALEYEFPEWLEHLSQWPRPPSITPEKSAESAPQDQPAEADAAHPPATQPDVPDKPERDDADDREQP